MDTTKTVFESRMISEEKLLSLISEMLGNQSNPNRDNLEPEEPWDRCIQKAARRIGLLAPSPQPWQSSLLYRVHSDDWNLSHPHNPDDFTPHPFPPRSMFLALLTQEVIDHTLLVQEVADGISQKNNERSIIIVSGTFAKYADDFDELCPRIIKIILKYPHNGQDGNPHPNWYSSLFSSIEIFSAAAVFYQNSIMTTNAELRQSLQQTGVKLVELGVKRL